MKHNLMSSLRKMELVENYVHNFLQPFHQIPRYHAPQQGPARQQGPSTNSVALLGLLSAIISVWSHGIQGDFIRHWQRAGGPGQART